MNWAESITSQIVNYKVCDQFTGNNHRGYNATMLAQIGNCKTTFGLKTDERAFTSKTS